MSNRALVAKLVLVVTGISLTWAVAESAWVTTDKSFNEVWNQVASDPYPQASDATAHHPQQLPQMKVALENFFRAPHLPTWSDVKNLDFSKLGVYDLLYTAANRTLRDRRDMLPPFNKLVHANGACLAGTWHITRANPYGGAFAFRGEGAKWLVIGRASVAGSDTVQGTNRAFGLALKVWPTDNADERAGTGNVFTIEDLGGTKNPFFTKAWLSNEPPASVKPGDAPLAVDALVAFRRADSHPSFRQVYPLSFLGEDEETVRTPYHLYLQGASDNGSVSERDFRDEVRPSLHNGHLYVNIFVAAKGEAPQKIGYIDFTEYAASYSCDHRLHFAHPRWREHLTY